MGGSTAITSAPSGSQRADTRSESVLPAGASMRALLTLEAMNRMASSRLQRNQLFPPEVVEYHRLVAGGVAPEAAEMAVLRGSAARGAMMEAVKKNSSSGDCGNIDIGNVDTGKKIGFGPRDVTVVITGDVINANNNCQ